MDGSGSLLSQDLQSLWPEVIIYLARASASVLSVRKTLAHAPTASALS